jgi:STI1 domain
MWGELINPHHIPQNWLFCSYIRSCLIQENKDPESIRRKAMQDPEVQQIITDPAMQMILQQMQKDPQALREWVQFVLCVGNLKLFQSLIWIEL